MIFLFFYFKNSEKEFLKLPILLAFYDKSLLQIEYVVIEIWYFQCYTQHKDYLIFMDLKRNVAQILFFFFLAVP